MTKLSDMPPEIRAKIYKKLDIVSLLKFGESGTKFIPEILRSLNQSDRKKLWFEAASKGYCRWLTVMATKQIVNAKDEDGWTALHWAARGGHLDCLEALIRVGVDLNAQTRCGSTALHVAARSGHLDCLEALIQVGADLNAGDKDSSTALHLATYYGKFDCLKALIQAGADLNAKDKEGWTALHYARDKELDCLKALIQAHSKNGSRPLGGADLNAQTDRGWTALHLAAWTANLDCVKALIQAGANLNLKTNDGQTALDLAITKDTRKILKNAGAQ